MQQEETFQLKPEGYRRARWRMTLWALGSVAICTALMAWIGQSLDNGLATGAPFLGLFTCALALWSIWKANPAAKEAFLKYRVVLTHTGISSEGAMLGRISIPFSEIGQIQRRWDGSLLVSSTSSMVKINLSRDLDGFERLEERLSKVVPITNGGMLHTLWEWRLIIGMAIVAGCFATMLIAKPVPLRIGAAISLILVLLAGLYLKWRATEELLLKESVVSIILIGATAYLMIQLWLGQV